MTNRSNHPLRRAMSRAQVSEDDAADSVGVDPKTVQRWVAGRVPQPRHRRALADLLDVSEEELWPRLGDQSSPTLADEVVAVYSHRGHVPRRVWQDVVAQARREIAVLEYSGLSLAEDFEIVRTLRARARDGVRVRLLLGDPDGPAVAERGRDEGLGDALAAQVRAAVALLRPLTQVDGVEIRLHATALPAALVRADDDVLVHQYLVGVSAAHTPVLHLRAPERAGEERPRSQDPLQVYADAFEHVWAGAVAIDRPGDPT